MIQYCGEPLRPRGSVLGLRTPGLEFRSLCQYHLIYQPICAHGWPITPFISFPIEQLVINPSIPTGYNKKHNINILYLIND